MPDSDKRGTPFHELNWLGRTAYLGGTAVRLAANAVDYTLDRAATAWAESERAFRDELDPNVEDAKIIEEREERDEER